MKNFFDDPVKLIERRRLTGMQGGITVETGDGRWKHIERARQRVIDLAHAAALEEQAYGRIEFSEADAQRWADSEIPGISEIGHAALTVIEEKAIPEAS